MAAYTELKSLKIPIFMEKIVKNQGLVEFQQFFFYMIRFGSQVKSNKMFPEKASLSYQ